MYSNTAPPGQQHTASLHSRSTTALEIDHINHNIYDCRLENLRLVRPEINRQNTIPRLTDDAVRTIRRRYAEQPISQEALARQFGVGKRTISNIVNHRTYRGVADE